MRHIPEPYALYAGIKKLEPAHAMIIRKGKVEKRWRYWTLDYKEEHVSTKRLIEALDGSIKSRLVSDVPISAMLSGGVDSSAVVYDITQLERNNINTYALGHDSQDSDLIRARKVAKRFNTNHKP